MPPTATSFRRLIGSPWRASLFLMTRLPSAYFSGVRVVELHEHSCVATVPYKWFSRNPFRSTYFACLAMAAELSTGVLALMHSYGRTPSVSMLVVKIEGEFFRKATGVTRFTCAQGEALQSAIEQAATSGEAVVLNVRSEGISAAGEPVANFYITWSFKVRKR